MDEVPSITRVEVSVAPWISIVLAGTGLILGIVILIQRRKMPPNLVLPLAIISVFLLAGAAFTFLMPTTTVISNLSSGGLDSTE